MQLGRCLLVVVVAACGTGWSVPGAFAADAEATGRYHSLSPSGEPRWVQSKNYYELGEEVVTPHIPWARPYAGGPLRALIISPRYSHRETIELAQRLSLDYTVIMMPENPDQVAPPNSLGMAGLDPEEILAEYQRKLAQDYAVIVLANCFWTAFPPEMQQQLLAKLKAGTGLLLTSQPKDLGETLQALLSGPREEQAEKDLVAGVPVKHVPGFLGDDPEKPAPLPLVVCFQHGQGRLALLSYPRGGSLTPAPPEDRVLPAVLYDYYHSLVARALVWVARKEPAQAIADLAGPEEPAPAEVFVKEPLNLQIVNRASAPVSRLLQVVVREWWGEPQVEQRREVSLAPGANAVAVPLDRLPRGPHFVDVWLKEVDSEAVVDWASAYLETTSPARIVSIELDQPSFAAGERVRGRVAVEGEVSPDGELRIQLRDSFGRLLAEQQARVSQAGTTPFVFPFPQPTAIQHEIVATLADPAGVVDRQRRVFAVAGLRYDDFAFVVWGAVGTNSYRQRMIAAETYRLGGDSAYGYGKAEGWEHNPIAYWTTRAGLSQFFYASYLGSGIDPQTHIRQICLSNPAEHEYRGGGMRTLAAANQHLGGIGYSTGDEYHLSMGEDLCWSPTCLAGLRERLKVRYGTLEALNAAWQTNFAAWEEVVPDTLEQARARGHYTAWAENRAYNEFVFADVHRLLREYTEAGHAGCPVGEEGMFDAHTYHGPDYEHFRTAATLLHGYERPTQDEHLRSLAPSTALTGYWWGCYFPRDYSEPKMRWHPWHALFNGFTSGWWWTASGSGSWPAGLAPDLTPQDIFRWTMEEVREIKRGPGKLLLHCDREHNGIAILYSMDSIRASAAHEGIGVAGSLPGVASYAWNLILEDLGYQYQYVAASDVQNGLLLRGEYDVLVLPSTVAMSEALAASIAAFVRNGGLLLTDLRPGILDEWGNPLERGRLDAVFGLAHAGLGRLTAPTTVRLTRPDVGAVRLPPRCLNPAVTLDGATALAECDGGPAVTHHHFGQGQAICLNFPLGDYYTSWHFAEPHVDQRFRPGGAALRQVVGCWLTEAGLRRPVSVTDAAGRGLLGAEAVFFRHGQARYLGIEYKPDLIYFINGDQDWIRAHYDRNPDVPPVRVNVELPAPAHVYDIRQARYLGHVQRFQASVKPGGALLFALLPYRVRGVRLHPVGPDDGEGVEERITARPPLRFRAEVVCRGREGEAPAELHCLRVDVFDPPGQEVRAYGQNVLAYHGQATFTVPFALNDPPGDWRIRIRDVASGEAAERMVKVK